MLNSCGEHGIPQTSTVARGGIGVGSATSCCLVSGQTYSKRDRKERKMKYLAMLLSLSLIFLHAFLGQELPPKQQKITNHISGRFSGFHQRACRIFYR
jgi:hypothetical protein